MSISSAVVIFVLLLSLLLQFASCAYYGHAVIRPTGLGPAFTGVVTFSQTDATSQVKIDLNVAGLNKGVYAIHIHQFGDAYDVNGTGAGTHFNPANTPHGCWPDENRHAGDIGNFTVEEDGKNSTFSFVRDIMDLSTKFSIIGRSVIIHTAADNCGQPTGNAGSFIGQGIIGIANPSAFADSANSAIQNLSEEPISAIGVFHPLTDAGESGSKLSGWIQFATIADTGLVRVTSQVFNVPASTIVDSVNIHAIHVHQYGHDEPTGTLVAGHFNANNGIHGPITDPTRHLGDLGNYTLIYNSQTQLYDGYLQLTLNLLSLTASDANVIGRGVILHADRDDGNPTKDPTSTGAAGKRIAAAVIGVSNRPLITPYKYDIQQQH